MSSIDEQRQIRAVLQIWDRTIAVTECLLANSRKQKQALTKRLLQPQRREDWLKHGWQRVAISDVAKIDRQSLPLNTPSTFSFRYIALSDVSGGKIASNLPTLEFKDAPSRARRVVQSGDIIFSTVRPALMGHAYISDTHDACIVSTGFSVLSVKEEVDNNYLYQCLFSEDLQRQLDVLVVGSSFPAISSSEVADLQINLPGRSEQTRIGKMLTAADRQISLLSQSIEFLHKQKRALLAQLLTGKRRARQPAPATEVAA